MKIRQLALVWVVLIFSHGVRAENTDKLPESVQLGMDYFSGAKRFNNGGPACVSCHNVNFKGLIPGGLLAKDLTQTGMAATAFLVGDGMPETMKRAYGNGFGKEEKSAQDLIEIEKEMAALSTFFGHVAESGNEPGVNLAGFGYMLIGGLGGFAALLLLIYFVWSDRKKYHTKQRIFDRQLSAPDSRN